MNEQLNSTINTPGEFETLNELNRQLLEKEKVYRTLAENSHDYISRFDISYRHIYANQAVARFFGLPVEELTGKTHRELGVPQAAIDIWEETLSYVFETKEPWRKITKFGEGYYDWQLVPEFDESGELVSVQSISRDMTEFFLAKEKLEADEKKITEQNRKLTRLLLERDKLFTLIAHDLRSPYTGITGYLHIMADHLEQNEDRMGMVIAGKIEKILEGSLDLLNELLQWSVHLSKGIKPAFRFIPLGNIVDQLIDFYFLDITKKKLFVDNKITNDISVFAPPEYLKAILRNLFTNAIKYSKENGVIYFDAIVSHENVEVLVGDSGIGIPEHLKPLIFTVAPEIKRIGTFEEPSAGFGLIITKDYVEQMGGSIRFSSKQNAGTTFIVSLPLVKDEE